MQQTSVVNHLQYLALLYLARRHWIQMHNERIKVFKKFLKRVIRRQMDCYDWLQTLTS